jgi:hypothetical protein
MAVLVLCKRRKHEKAAGKRLVLAKLFFNISEKCTD